VDIGDTGAAHELDVHVDLAAHGVAADELADRGFEAFPFAGQLDGEIERLAIHRADLDREGVRPERYRGAAVACHAFHAEQKSENPADGTSKSRGGLKQ